MPLAQYQGLPPGARGYMIAEGQAQEAGQRNLANLTQATKLQGALQKMQMEQQLRGVLAQVGGDPKKAMEALLASGTPQGIELATHLKGLLPKPPEPYTLAPDATRYGPDNKPLAYGVPKAKKPVAKWSEPYQMGGAWVQKEEGTGQIRQSVGREPRTTVNMPSSVQTHTDGAGNLWERERGGQWRRAALDAGSPGMAPKLSPAVLKDQQAKLKLKNDLDQIIPNLEAISKDGGLLDKSTGSGAGALVDVAAGFVGKATPGSIAVGKLKPMVDPILKLVPRFEGPQSDKDVQSYKDAAGDLANPAVPNARKKEAAKTILEIYKRRRSQFTNTDYEASVTPSAPASPTTPVIVDFNSLPK